MNRGTASKGKVINDRIEEDREAPLVQKAREGSVEAFGELVKLYQDRVYNLAFRLTGGADAAWDLSQEAFLRAFAGMKSFRGESGFFTWIYRITLNLHMNWEKRLGSRMGKSVLSLDHSRDGQKRPGMHEEVACPSPIGDPSEETIRKEREEAVQKAIASLPPDYRQTVLLRDMEGMSYEEIADLLSLPLGTVRSRLHRAREALKERLEGFW